MAVARESLEEAVDASIEGVDVTATAEYTWTDVVWGIAVVVR